MPESSISSYGLGDASLDDLDDGDFPVEVMCHLCTCHGPMSTLPYKYAGYPLHGACMAAVRAKCRQMVSKEQAQEDKNQMINHPEQWRADTMKFKTTDPAARKKARDESKGKYTTTSTHSEYSKSASLTEYLTMNKTAYVSYFMFWERKGEAELSQRFDRILKEQGNAHSCIRNGVVAEEKVRVPSAVGRDYTEQGTKTADTATNETEISAEDFMAAKRRRLSKKQPDVQHASVATYPQGFLPSTSAMQPSSSAASVQDGIESVSCASVSTSHKEHKAERVAAKAYGDKKDEAWAPVADGEALTPLVFAQRTDALVAKLQAVSPEYTRKKHGFKDKLLKLTSEVDKEVQVRLGLDMPKLVADIGSLLSRATTLENKLQSCTKEDLSKLEQQAAKIFSDDTALQPVCAYLP